MNSSTTLTLNDRFSLMKKPIGVPQPQAMRGRGGRSRSRSRSRGNRGQPLAGSRRNQLMLDQLEKQHKMRLALKLKKQSIARTTKRRPGSALSTVKRAAALLGAKKLRRNNTLTTFIPLNDVPRGPLRGGRSRSRSRSRGGGQNRSRSQSRNRNQQLTLSERLGVRQPRRMRRGQVQQLPQQQQRSRSRPRSRVRLNRNNFNNNGQQNPRSNSVNDRLGNKGPKPVARRRLASSTRNRNSQLNRPIAGRIIKRVQKKPLGGGRNVGNGRQGQGTSRQIANGRNIRGGRNFVGNGKAMKRNSNRAQNQIQAGRGRARNRQNSNQNAGIGARRGRSRTRRNGNVNGRGGARSQISKEQLDKQLDDYMAKGSA